MSAAAAGDGLQRLIDARLDATFALYAERIDSLGDRPQSHLRRADRR